MNPRYASASDPAESRIAATSVEFQDLCSLGMDRAIEIEKATLDTVVRLNSCACDIYKHALWGGPIFGYLLNPAANVLAFYVELQMRWIAVMLPHVNAGSESWLPEVALSNAVASSSEGRPTAEMLEQSMDIVIGGLETPGSTVASNPEPQPQHGNRARAHTA